MPINPQKQSAKKFVEYWTFNRPGSEKSGCQQYWNMLLRELLGQKELESVIRYQVPVQVSAAPSTKHWPSEATQLKTCALIYIIGNPPFVGHQYRSKEQAADMDVVFADIADTNYGKLDYVCFAGEKVVEAKNVNGYLIDAANPRRGKPANGCLNLI